MSWLGRLFGRKAASPTPQPTIVDQRRMNEDWKIGDLAVCLSDKWAFESRHSPMRGDLLRVSDIRAGMCGNNLFIALAFEGKPPGCGWDCIWFRKVRPDDRAALLTAEWVDRVRHLEGEPVDG